MVHELEEVFPILADFTIDLSGVFELAREELLGGAGQGLDVVVCLQHHLRRNCSNKNKMGLVNFIRKEDGKGYGSFDMLESGRGLLVSIWESCC